MNPRPILAIAHLLLASVILIPSSGPAIGCAPAPGFGQTVQIADESAIIIWDKESKTEHFIRRASFTTEARDFGFLVPTPSQPTLAEASDEAFTQLADLTKPQVITQPRPAPPPSSGCACGTRTASFSAVGSAMPEPAVRVLHEQSVAGHDAVVLEADDAKALSTWLKEHGYEFSPVLTEWVAPYVKAGWKITAFKIAKGAAESPSVGTSAVRMTFKTDRPFFPYREPASEAPPGNAGYVSRLLRVYFLSDGRVEGALDEKENEKRHWPGNTVWSNRLQDTDRGRLLPLLKLAEDTAPATWWLTEFEDRSSPRPGTADVYFANSWNQSSIARPPIIQYVSNTSADPILACGLTAFVVLGGLVRPWRWLRGSAHTASPQR